MNFNCCIACICLLLSSCQSIYSSKTEIKLSNSNKTEIKGGNVNLENNNYELIKLAEKGNTEIQHTVSAETNVCNSCHGDFGESRYHMLDVPILAGLPKSYMLKQLTNFEKSGDVFHKTLLSSASLHNVIKKYISIVLDTGVSFPTVAEKNAAGHDLFMNGNEILKGCQSCHGQKGQGNDTTPFIVGQKEVYLRKVLFRYRDGERRNGLDDHTFLERATVSELNVLVAYLSANGQVKLKSQATSTKFTPKDLYNQYCSLCHKAGLLNAPIPNMSSEIWKVSKEKGLKTLVKNSINGYNAMPPKGGASGLTNEDIASIVKYMMLGIPATQ
jgi:cytochrome c5